MPERERYAHRFEGPALEADPHAAYRTLQWGNDPEDTWDIDAPESLVALGTLAKVVLRNGREAEWSERWAPFLAVGTESNNLYAIPATRGGRPRNVPAGEYERIGRVVRTDYYSEKGGELGYYYHDHEQPYPVLYEYGDTGVMIWVPAQVGQNRSYVVAEEGIIG